MDSFCEAGDDAADVGMEGPRFRPVLPAAIPEEQPDPGRALRRTGSDLARTLAAIALPDLFGHVPDPAIGTARARFRRRVERGRRRDAALTILAEPWTARELPADPRGRAATTLARRFLRRHPERDRPDPARDLLGDREAAAAWHFEEEALDRQRPPGTPEDDAW